MYIETFKVFGDLAETGSFSKAAALNAITQSAVSQQIRALEERFKVKLVERGQRNISLTPEGSAFLEASREILEIYNHLGDRLHQLRNVVAGNLRIASIYSIGMHDLPLRLKVFRQRYPGLEVFVEYRRSAQVYSQVLNGEADLGLVAYPSRRAGLRIDIFDEDPLVLICHPVHPLARHEQVTLTQLQGQKFIAFEPDLPTRKAIDRHLREQQVQIAHVMEFDNIETVKRAVEIESGISIVPSNTVRQEVQSGALASVVLEGGRLCRPLGAITRRSRPRTPAQSEFLAALRGELKPEEAVSLSEEEQRR